MNRFSLAAKVITLVLILAVIVATVYVWHEQPTAPDATQQEQDAEANHLVKP